MIPHEQRNNECEEISKHAQVTIQIFLYIAHKDEDGDSSGLNFTAPYTHKLYCKIDD